MNAQPTIVVTGAGGYIGRHVARAAAERGARVIAVSRRSVDDTLLEHPGIERLQADVFSLDEGAWATIRGATALIHLAWQDGFVLQSRKHGEQLSSHFDFLTAAAERGIRQISVLGTMHEIGYWEGAVDASTPERPANLYGTAKVALRSLLQSSLPPLEANLQWLRCYYILGDDRRNNSVFRKMLDAADAGRTEFPFTSGRNRFDFIKVDRLAGQIVAAALRDDVSGIIECCTGEPRSLGEVAEEFIAENDLPLVLQYGAFPDRPHDSPGTWGDATLISSILAADESGRRPKA